MYTLSPDVDGKIHRPDGANVAFLLIHGFRADIDEMASLGEALAEQGVASFSVRVAGHGTTPEDLATTTSGDWYNSVLNGLNLVKSWETQYVFVAGLSMGGVLTLLLSTQEEGIDGIVVFSPAIIVGGFAGKLVPLLKIFMKYRNVDLSYIPKMYDLPRTKYDREPLSAIHELLKFVKEARKKLPKVIVPRPMICRVFPRKKRNCFMSLGRQCRPDFLVGIDQMINMLPTLCLNGFTDHL